MVAACLMLLWPVTMQAETGGIEPRWDTGATWDVAAHYRAPEKNAWSKPVMWRYTVLAVPGRGSDGYVIDVRPVHGGRGVTARLSYREDYSLETVTMIREMGGGLRESSFSYDTGAPVLTSGSPFPFDTPVFPLVSPSTEDYAARRRMADGLSYQVNISQSVVSEGNDGRVSVTCQTSNGHSFRQDWLAGMPWPVEGENEAMKYELVKK